MNAKERVITTFEHREPDRVPLWYGASDALTARLMQQCNVSHEEALMQRLHIDFRRVHERYIGPDLGAKTYWGIERGGGYYGQPLTHPLAGVETVEQVAAYTGWPSPDWFDFSHLRQECEPWRDYAIIGGPWAVVFTDATELVGMGEFFMKMHTHPEVMHAVMQKVSDFYYELALRFFEAAGDLLDIFFFGDDIGTQQSMIISLPHWREFCKPHVERFLKLGKQAGLKTMFHSCGAVRKMIPDLVEMGLDALNPIQVRARGMDLRELKTEFGARMAFHGGFDHQQVLPFGSEADVRAEAHRVIDIMAPGGGYCLAPSHDLMLDDFPPHNVIAMYDEAYQYGRYTQA
ncbi:MAG: uroporphyrinogen decarboxylase family protein [Chloroflexi bacterium]|nr:uroporphyrinogen decarboxylase family protein [Chloroflexota bacterium]MCL5274876.1 uroporphyrinogen decarboxylase family protein [Chloroflexota bacterium]